jgi:hypothetical protein
LAHENGVVGEEPLISFLPRPGDRHQASGTLHECDAELISGHASVGVREDRIDGDERAADADDPRSEGEHLLLHRPIDGERFEGAGACATEHVSTVGQDAHERDRRIVGPMRDHVGERADVRQRIPRPDDRRRRPTAHAEDAGLPARRDGPAGSGHGTAAEVDRGPDADVPAAGVHDDHAIVAKADVAAKPDAPAVDLRPLSEEDDPPSRGRTPTA